MAWAPVEHAVTTAWFGPRSWWRIEIWPDARLIRRPGMKNGLMAARPLLGHQERGLLNALKPADAGAEEDAGAYLILIGLGMPAGIVQGLIGRGD